MDWTQIAIIVFTAAATALATVGIQLWLTKPIKRNEFQALIEATPTIADIEESFKHAWELESHKKKNVFDDERESVFTMYESLNNWFHKSAHLRVTSSVEKFAEEIAEADRLYSIYRNDQSRLTLLLDLDHSLNESMNEFDMAIIELQKVLLEINFAHTIYLSQNHPREEYTAFLKSLHAKPTEYQSNAIDKKQLVRDKLRKLII